LITLMVKKNECKYERNKCDRSGGNEITTTGGNANHFVIGI
jgi:hypothetical protein